MTQGVPRARRRDPHAPHSFQGLPQRPPVLPRNPLDRVKILHDSRLSTCGTTRAVPCRVCSRSKTRLRRRCGSCRPFRAPSASRRRMRTEAGRLPLDAAAPLHSAHKATTGNIYQNFMALPAPWRRHSFEIVKRSAPASV